MARAQTGGLITGGGLDPYVAAASGQRSAQGSRMREAAMSEQGATKRQAMSNEAGVAQSAIQAASARAMQDAQMADAERGRREDAEYRKQEIEMTDNLARERMKLENEINRANQAEDYKTVEKLSRRLDAQDALDRLVYENSNRNYMNMVKNLVEAQGNKQSGMEKARSIDLQNLEKAQQHNQILSTQMDAALSSIKSNKKLDYDPVAAQATAGEAMARYGITGGMGFGGRTTTGRKPDRNELINQAHNSRMEDVVNGALTHIGVNSTSVAELREPGLKTLEKSIQDGKVDAADIPRIAVALNAAIDAAKEKVGMYPEGEGYRFYNKWIGDLREMKSRLHSLGFSKSKHTNNPNVTVGMTVTQGLSWLPGAERSGTSYEDAVTKVNDEYNSRLSGMIPSGTSSLFPSLDDELTQAYLKVYPELGEILPRIQPGQQGARGSGYAGTVRVREEGESSEEFGRRFQDALTAGGY